MITLSSAAAWWPPGRLRKRIFLLVSSKTFNLLDFFGEVIERRLQGRNVTTVTQVQFLPSPSVTKSQIIERRFGIMPAIAEKKAPGLSKSPETNKHKNNNTTKKRKEAIENPLGKYNLKELSKIISMKQISERMRAARPQIVKENTCPDCDHFPIVKDTTGGNDPQDTITFNVCPLCRWTNKPQLFSEITPKEVLDRIEDGEVAF
jgi:RNase P subunit RPR2